MLRDVEYFKTRIGGLDGAAETADFFVNLVKAKPVPKPKAPTPPPVEPLERAETNGATEPIEETESTTEDKVREEQAGSQKQEADTETVA